MCVLISAASAAPIEPGGTLTVTVDGKTGIYAVEGNDGSPGGGGAVLDAVSIEFTAGSTNIFNVTASGLINCCSGTPDTSADGGTAFTTNISAANGLSASVGNSMLPLLGVFTDGTDPAGETPPSTLSWNRLSPTSLSPVLRQVFHIGDGREGYLNGAGTILQFTAPPGATKLFLGFADAFGFSGVPGFYGDNTGSLSVDVTAAAAQCPATDAASFAPALEGQRVGTELAAKLAAVNLFPISFEVNRGQVDARVKFLSRSPAGTLFLTAEEVVLALPPSAAEEDQAIQAASLRIRLIGANPDPAMTGEDLLETRSSYFIGNDPAAWHRGIRHYAKVRYAAVYPGIDLIYYGTEEDALEHDFIVSPGVDPGVIAFRVSGAEQVRIAPEGHLVLDLPGGEVQLTKPLIYQQVDGERRTVEGGFTLSDDAAIGFEVAAYDASLPLVIDPVLRYSTYLGGFSNASFDTGVASASPNTQFVVLATFAADFPVDNGSSCSGGCGDPDLVVIEINRDPADDSVTLNKAFIGGTGREIPFDIAVTTTFDGPIAQHLLYIVGRTTSPDFPFPDQALIPTKIVQVTFGGTKDGFLTILRPDDPGFVFVYSTYLGGDDSDEIISVDVDNFKRVYVGGETQSKNFPIFPTRTGGVPVSDTIFCKSDGTRCFDGFAAIIDPTVPVFCDDEPLIYSTYFGGGGPDGGFTAVDRVTGIAHSHPQNGEAVPFFYIVGSTRSSDPPLPTTPGAFDTTCGDDGTCGSDDAFLAVINPKGLGMDDLFYSTFLGGKFNDKAFDVDVEQAVDSESGLVQKVYIVGESDSEANSSACGNGFSEAFPTTEGAFDNSEDVTNLAHGFLTVIDPPDPLHPADPNSNACDVIEYSTVIADRNGGFHSMRVVDVEPSSGRVAMAGKVGARAKDMPLKNPLQKKSSGGDDSYIMVLDPDNTLPPDSQNLFSTYLGGRGNDGSNGVSWVLGSNELLVTGTTDSARFPTTRGSFQRRPPFNLINHGFYSRISEIPANSPDFSVEIFRLRNVRVSRDCASTELCPVSYELKVKNIGPEMGSGTVSFKHLGFPLDGEPVLIDSGCPFFFTLEPGQNITLVKRRDECKLFVPKTAELYLIEVSVASDTNEPRLSNNFLERVVNLN